MKIVRFVVLAFVGLLAIGVTWEQWSRWRAPRLDPPSGELIDIGERRLHLDCAGSRLPAVVFEAGGGSPSIAWESTQRRVARVTTACSYDRAGIGWSDGAAGPRGADQLIGDLSSLLRESSLAPPYVLVGHSLGGPIIGVFADRHPDQLAGLVFVDPTPPALSLRQVENWRIVDRVQLLAMRVLDETGLFRLSLSRSPRFDEYTRLFGPRDHATMMREIRDSYSLLAESAQIESFGTLPMVVLSGGKLPTATERLSTEDLQQIQDGRLAEHGELASRSTRGEHRVIDAGHFIQLENPQAVAQAILQVVETVRSDGAAQELPPLR